MHKKGKNMINDNPLVYIVIVNYNGYEDTIECIKSLEKIEYDNYKVIIIDNNSTNNSEKIMIQKLPQYNIIQTGKNIGFAGANNIGIKYALTNNSDYVLLLNNDTIVDKFFLNNLIKNVGSKERVGISTGKIYYYSDKKKLWYGGGSIYGIKGIGNHKYYNKEDNDNNNHEKYITFASGCFMLLSKEMIKDVGYLNEDYFMYYEDVDYCKKVLNKGYKILYCPKSIIYHKISSSIGSGSELSQYYKTRNVGIYIRSNLHGLEMIFWYLFYINKFFVKALLFKQNNKAVFKGIKDFLKGKVNYSDIT